MPKIVYTHKKFNDEHRLVIDRSNAIIHKMANDGYTLTLRQLYYQHVAHDLFPDSWLNAEGTKNSKQSYNKLGDIISAARRAGLVDWDAIEDRTRNVQKASTWDSPSQIIGAVAAQYETDHWAGQPYRVEVFVEKDALVGIMQKACDPYQVPYFSCRGYTSDSEMWKAARRLSNYEMEHDQTPLVLHLGDHDPSGVDMTRDIEERLNLFSRGTGAAMIEVRRIALTMDQVKQYDPPPNFAKESDCRHAKYKELYGENSWELDALSSQVLEALITDEIHNLIDHDAWDEAVARTNEGLAQLKNVSDNWGEIVSNL